jgi:hypothetical protein
METMTPSRNQKDLSGFDFVMPRRLHARLKVIAKKSGMTLAEFARRVLAREAGDESLATMPRGIGEKMPKKKGRNGNGHI